jgi:hypothetical protein
MAKITRYFSGVVLAAGLLIPAVAVSKDHEEKSRAGGAAAEHRSERAAERSNAQWQDDAKRGQDWAEEMLDKGKAKAGKGSEESDEEAEEASKGSEGNDEETEEAGKGSEETDEDSAKAEKKGKDRAEEGKAKAGKASEETGEGSGKQPEGRAKGFWQRWFGFGADDNEEEEESD